MRAISTCFWLLASACAWHLVDASAIAPQGLNNNFDIWGGKPIKITEAPYMALFRPKTYNWHCGAVIIHEQFLLTAGHCIVPDIEYMRITVGSDNVVGGKDYEINKIVRHPKFFMNTTMVDYDISIIKLKEKLKFDDKVKAVQIADSTLPSQEETVESMGFGMTRHRGPSKVLLKVDLEYVNRTRCHKLNKPYIISERSFCAGLEKGKNICHGDLGGPVVYKGKLIGVNSWLRYGSCENLPGGFAYVPSMKDFIDDVIKNNS